MIETTRDVLNEKLTMPSLGGVMLSPRRPSRKCQTALGQSNPVVPGLFLRITFPRNGADSVGRGVVQVTD
jgi:hypothetical protein